MLAAPIGGANPGSWDNDRVNEPDYLEDPTTVACDNCVARCCRLTVVLMPSDDVPVRYVEHDEHDLPTMARGDDGWCLALDRGSLRCTIYEQRPLVCREFPEGGDDCLAERALWRRSIAAANPEPRG